VTGFSHDCYWSSKEVIVISLGTPWSSGENFGCTRECLGELATSLGAQMTRMEAPTTRLGAPQTAVEQCAKNNIFFSDAAGAP